MRIVICSRGLQGGKSPSEIVNIADSKKINSCAGDDLMVTYCYYKSILSKKMDFKI
ncbi:hypothetical protein [Clostridium sp. FP1]|uniref:hypothetical protein n=1 Tax=Clostridium sp. FP1 TaxID=2724076 RepID=UPI0013E97A99|nr:hypothetical protein [Clostridium sp. FP1]MBZ9637823.1 hypothetical protein [Clostridium sp. FP1]